MRTAEMISTLRTNEVSGIPSEDTVTEYFLFERFSQTEITPDSVEKTSEKIWGQLSTRGKIIAKAISFFPSSVRETTLESIISREENLEKELDVREGLNELAEVGVLNTTTLLDILDTAVDTFKHQDEKIDTAESERRLMLYRRAIAILAQHSETPDPNLEIPEYTLKDDFKQYTNTQRVVI